MNASTSDVVGAFQQQLRADMLMGLRFVPLRVCPDALASLGSTGFTTSHGVQAHPVQPASRIAGDASSKGERLRLLDEGQVRGCRKCVLCQGRTQTVFGQGSAGARLVFVGEGPGFEEDKQGLAFVGAAGQLLTKMIVAMGLTRDEVYICNVVKCRPPGNRTPLPEEIAACFPYLQEQLATIGPEVIVALGAPASQTLLNTGIPIGRLRGRFHDYYVSGQEGVGAAVPVMPTYHPAYLLRTPGDKGKTWDDLQQVMAKLGLKKP